MIDKVDLRKNKISQAEKETIIKISNLKQNVRNGKIYFDNKERKNFTGGFYIKIDTRNRLKLVGSIHKYYNFLKGGKLDNYNNFTIDEARETIKQLLFNHGISINDVLVYQYEIGLNIGLHFDCRNVLDNVLSIKNKELLFNPKYKDKRIKTTCFHSDFRTVYVIYDKVHEMKDKRRQPPKKPLNIIRLEYRSKKNYKLQLLEFLEVEFLTNLREKFFKDFRELKYKKIVKYKGAGYSSQIKMSAVKLILTHGKTKAIEMINERLKTGELTQRNHRTQREFINGFFAKNEFENYEFSLTSECAEFDNLLNIEYQTVTNEN